MHTLNQLQEAFGIPSVTYYDWKEKIKTGLAFGIKAKGCRKCKINKETLKKAVETKPSVFLRELARQFNCTPVAVHYTFENMGVKQKKQFILYERSEEKRAEFNKKIKRVPEQKS